EGGRRCRGEQDGGKNRTVELLHDDDPQTLARANPGMVPAIGGSITSRLWQLIVCPRSPTAEIQSQKRGKARFFARYGPRSPGGGRFGGRISIVLGIGGVSAIRLIPPLRVGRCAPILKLPPHQGE